MTQITHNLLKIQQRILAASKRYGRYPDSVKLLAVSKKHSAAAIIEANEAGQLDFGENFATEAIEKQRKVTNSLVWHFIGKIQSNKTKLIAQHFDWVHSVDRAKIAHRLNSARGPGAPLNVLIQVNVSNDPDRSGIAPEQVPALASEIAECRSLQLRGLMAMAPNTDSFDVQSAAFAEVHTLYKALQDQGHSLDSLSMGMSADLEAAIANGATWVRIGTDIFGKRPSD